MNQNTAKGRATAAKAAAPPLPPLLGVVELAEYVGVPVKTVYNWRPAGKGPRGIRIGRHVRYRREDVEAWLESQADPLP